MEFSIERLGELADKVGLTGENRFELLRDGIQGMTEGLIQRSGPEQVYRECRELNQELALFCTRGIVRYLLNGDIRDGSTDRAIPFCLNLPDDDLHGMRAQCYTTLLHELKRLYTVENRVQFCAQLPDEHRDMCMAEE